MTFTNFMGMAYKYAFETDVKYALHLFGIS